MTEATAQPDWVAFDDADLLRLTDAFGLRVNSSSPLPSGHTVVRRLNCDHGQFVLHVHDATLSRQQVEAMQMVREAMADAGLPAAAPERDLEGRTIVDWEGRVVEVQPWIEHDGYLKNEWADVSSLCEVLARMHDVMSTTDVTPDPAGNNGWLVAEELVNKIDRDADAMRADARKLGRDIEEPLAMARDLLQKFAEVEGNANSRPLEPTHSDLYGRNVLMMGQSVAAVVDFERLDLRPRTADLAWAMFWPFFISDLDDIEAVDWQGAGACCRAYAESTSRPFSDDEWVQVGSADSESTNGRSRHLGR